MRRLEEGEDVSPMTGLGECDGLEGELADGLLFLFVLLLWLLFGLTTLFEASPASPLPSPGWSGDGCRDFRE